MEFVEYEAEAERKKKNQFGDNHNCLNNAEESRWLYSEPWCCVLHVKFHTEFYGSVAFT